VRRERGEGVLSKLFAHSGKGEEGEERRGGWGEVRRAGRGKGRRGEEIALCLLHLTYRQHYTTHTHRLQ
jgi:hypothetical protein